MAGSSGTGQPSPRGGLRVEQAQMVSAIVVAVAVLLLVLGAIDVLPKSLLHFFKALFR
jgi:hypothetical protein